LYGWEASTIKWMQKNTKLFVFFLVSIVALIVRTKGWFFESSDYTYFLYDWFSIIRTKGGLGALSGDFYNYYIPYMCIISLPTYFHRVGYYEFMSYLKAVSVLSEFACAILAVAIVKRLVANSETRDIICVLVYSVVLLSPMVVIDGAFWTQCDYIYAAFVLWGFIKLIDGKYNLAFLLFGCAFSFKLQTIMIIPALLLIYLANRSFSILKFLWIPFVYLVAGLPAILWGKGIIDTYSIYFGQVDKNDVLTANAPNFWTFFPEDAVRLSYFGIAILFVIFILFVVSILKREYSYTMADSIFLLMLWSGLCFCFLPGMHERYCSLWILLMYIYFAIFDVRRIYIPFVLDILTCTTFFVFLYYQAYNPPVPYCIIAAIRIGVILWLAFRFFTQIIQMFLF